MTERDMAKKALSEKSRTPKNEKCISFAPGEPKNDGKLYNWPHVLQYDSTVDPMLLPRVTLHGAKYNIKSSIMNDNEIFFKSGSKTPLNDSKAITQNNPASSFTASRR